MLETLGIGLGCLVHMTWCVRAIPGKTLLETFGMVLDRFRVPGTYDWLYSWATPGNSASTFYFV